MNKSPYFKKSKTRRVFNSIYRRHNRDGNFY